MGEQVSKEWIFHRTGRLYAKPSFLEGFARVLDLGATLSNIYNRNLTPREADFDSLLSDWAAVGDDISYAIQYYGAQQSV